VIGSTAAIDLVFRHLKAVPGPLIYDVTVSGPSGEDVIGQQGIEAVQEHLETPDLVTVRLRDAELLAGMEIPSLDDAQVAVQRIGQLGAQRVLLRCGRLPTHHFDTESTPPNYAVDLFYDGEDIALFEAPHLLSVDNVHGASSALLMPLLHALTESPALKGNPEADASSPDEATADAEDIASTTGPTDESVEPDNLAEAENPAEAENADNALSPDQAIVQALQDAKGRVTETLRHRQDGIDAPNYFYDFSFDADSQGGAAPSARSSPAEGSSSDESASSEPAASGSSAENAASESNGTVS
jgi:hypothetical protein